MPRATWIRYVVLGTIAAVVAVYLLASSRSTDTAVPPRSYPDIVASGTLRATTEYNAIGYFVDGDTITGFHYELAQAFARSKGLRLELTPEMELQKQIDGTHQGRFDLIAGSLLITGEQRDSVLSFTTPIFHTRQVLVQRKPADGGDSTYISQPLQLGGQTVYIPQGSPVRYRINHLSTEIAELITVKEVERYGSEQLLAMVAHGDIRYAICDERLAQAALERYPQIDISTAISFNQFYGWGVPTESQALLDTLNAWLGTYMKTTDFTRLLRKYRLQ